MCIFIYMTCLRGRIVLGKISALTLVHRDHFSHLTFSKSPSSTLKSRSPVTDSVLLVLANAAANASARLIDGKFDSGFASVTRCFETRSLSALTRGLPHISTSRFCPSMSLASPRLRSSDGNDGSRFRIVTILWKNVSSPPRRVNLFRLERTFRRLHNQCPALKPGFNGWHNHSDLFEQLPQILKHCVFFVGARAIGEEELLAQVQCLCLHCSGTKPVPYRSQESISVPLIFCRVPCVINRSHIELIERHFRVPIELRDRIRNQPVLREEDQIVGVHAIV